MEIAVLGGEFCLEYKYTLVRSTRTSLSLEIQSDLTVVVRAPNRCSMRDIQKFVESREQWLGTHMEKQRQRLSSRPMLTQEDRPHLLVLAKEQLPFRVDYYAKIMGLSPAGVKITSAEKRFGSCSAKNSLCFSWRLMAYPQEAIDYVIVHELAHIVYKNHGKDFYSLIAQVLPDYKARIRLLKG